METLSKTLRVPNALAPCGIHATRSGLGALSAPSALSSQIRPLRKFWRPAIAANRLDFPLPDGPTKAVTLPDGNLAVTLSKTSLSPNPIEARSTWISIGRAN